jgi:hypothetical protein
MLHAQLMPDRRMTLSIWILLGGYIIGVAPFAVLAAYLLERRRALMQALSAAQASREALVAERDSARLACADLQAQAPQREATPEAQEAQAVEGAGAYLALCRVALALQRSLAISRAEILRLDAELRRRPSGERVPVTAEERAQIVAAASAHTSRRAVARAVFGNTGKHTYSKVKHVCDAEGLLLPDGDPGRRRLGAAPAAAGPDRASVRAGAPAPRGRRALSAVEALDVAGDMG